MGGGHARGMQSLLHFWIFFFFVFFSFLFFRVAPAAHGGFQAMDRIGAAYATALATPDPSRICDLHHNSPQRWILNPLNKARDGTRNRMVPSRILICCPTVGTPHCWIFNPLSEARDGTQILMDTSWVLNPLIRNRKSLNF